MLLVISVQDVPRLHVWFHGTPTHGPQLPPFVPGCNACTTWSTKPQQKTFKKKHKKHGCCYSPWRAGYTWWTQPIKSLQGKGFKWRTKYSLICLPQHSQSILSQTWNITRSTLWKKHQVSKCCARHRKTYYTLRARLFNIKAEDVGLCSFFVRCCLDKVRGKVPLSQRS